MKNIIFGGRGVLGSHLTSHLLEIGEAVTIISTNSLLPSVTVSEPPGSLTTVLSLDSVNRRVLRDLISEGSTVWFLRSFVSPLSRHCSELILTSERTYFRDILEVAAEKASMFVFYSSGGAVYGNQTTLPAKESADCNPLSVYGRQKLDYENLLKNYVANAGCSYRIFRIGNVFYDYTPHAIPVGLIATLLNALVKKQEARIYGYNQVRDYLHARDITNTVVNATRHNCPDGLYNVGSGMGIPTRDIINHLNSVTGGLLSYSVVDPEESHVDTIYLDISKISRLVGHSLEVSVLDFISKWVSINRQAIRG